MAAPIEDLKDDAPHLLVVDNDRRLRALLSRYLSENGFRVTVAADAAEARQRLAGLSFDLMIVDVMIAQPKRIQGIYDSLPERKRKGIEDRDG